MGQIRKINGIYYIEFHARGLLYSQLGGKSKAEAQELLDRVEGKISAGEALTIIRHIELPDFFDRFMAEIKRQFPENPVTVGRYATTIKHFSGFLDENFPQAGKLDQLTPAIFESYKSYLSKIQKVKTVNLSILLIRDIMDFGIKLGFINDNPSLHLRLLPWPKAPQRRQSARYKLAGQLLTQGVGLAKLARLLKLADISRAVYFSPLIPLSREDVSR